MKWTIEEHDFVKKHVDRLSDQEMAVALKRSQKSVKRFREYREIKRNPLFVRQLISTGQFDGTQNQNGHNNPNWKNGISKNNYHYKKIQKKRYPERMAARSAAYDALVAGKIIKKPCEVCGDTESQMHHDDYNKPFDVRFLCRKHHRAEHQS